MIPLLETNGLSVAYGRNPVVPWALKDVSLRVNEGTCLGIVGESGSGKTTFGHAILGLLGSDSRISGRFLWEGTPIQIGSARHRASRGRGLSLVPQDALASLNPSITVEEHFVDTLHDVLGLDRASARSRALHWMDQVRIRDPVEILRGYPHQLSGGQRQRVLIALALCTSPRLVVLDECTTALDVTVQAQILQILGELRNRLGLSMIVISHDLEVVSSLADKIAVLYAGQVLEEGSVELFTAGRAYHPYTKGLIRSTPRLETQVGRLPVIKGRLPLGSLPDDDCVFRPRCPFARDTCQRAQALETFQQGVVRCGRATEIAAAAWPGADQPIVRVRKLGAANLLEAQGLSKTLYGARRRAVHAVSEVDLSIARGETLGLVGESGSGKTTIARCITGIIAPTEGQIRFDGSLVADRAGFHGFPHSRIQLVFQDPKSSMNPRLTILEQVARPIRLYENAAMRAANLRALEMLEVVGLSRTFGNRYPRELSGGEAQRASIGRALAARPQLVVLDEPVTALDVSVQAAILNLLADLRDEFEVTYLLIGHDLAVVRHMADRVVVLKEGKVVEQGEASFVFAHPQNAYTQELVNSIPHRMAGSGPR